MAERVVGQPRAIQAVADAIRRNKSGIGDENRPTGTFLFLGPTGVGKTELAKTIAGFLFDDERALTRIDMSEYMERHAVSRLIGAPPGYVGYDQGGQLTEVVRRRPYSVILLDEIEKAHPDVFNVFLQLLDEGRLTDGQGRLVDFRNAIVVMTSNIGSDLILGAEDLDAVRDQIHDRLRQAFRPEFLNRLDEVITFRRLTRAHILRIVDLEVERLHHRIGDRSLRLELTDPAREHLADLGFDPAFGARPLKRAVQQHIQNPLARRLLAGDFPTGVQFSLTDGMEARYPVQSPGTRRRPGPRRTQSEARRSSRSAGRNSVRVARGPGSRVSACVDTFFAPGYALNPDGKTLGQRLPP